MIHYENGEIEFKGTPARILSELTMTIHGVRVVLEQRGFEFKDIDSYLFEAYKFGRMSEDEMEEFIKTHDLREVIPWEKDLN